MLITRDLLKSCCSVEIGFDVCSGSGDPIDLC